MGGNTILLVVDISNPSFLKLSGAFKIRTQQEHLFTAKHSHVNLKFSINSYSIPILHLG
ncbi:hypothetical protein [Candidatus Terasakiella magnetica]|uniref:hypothetical protein n=1 Tax=Candidatus Terasakiella magnetica TaxID=1867952 RepID=UPI003B838F8D